MPHVHHAPQVSLLLIEVINLVFLVPLNILQQLELAVVQHVLPITTRLVQEVQHVYHVVPLHVYRHNVQMEYVPILMERMVEHVHLVHVQQLLVILGLRRSQLVVEL